MDKAVEAKMDDDSLTEDEIIEIYDNADKQLSGIFFNSDNNKNESLFEIEIGTIRKLFKKVGKCNVTRIEMKYDELIGDYTSVRFGGEQKISEEAE